MSDLKELKQEADDLGVKYAKNITAEKLQAKIDAHYEAQETSGPAVQEAVAEVEEAKKEAPKKAAAKSGMDPVMQKRHDREREARKTKVITIVDNDQRVNNHTTTCTASCANEFFDLGTKIFPLNEKIEVAVGHIKTLEGVKIPLHTRDNKTGLSTVKLRPRYTISYH